MAKQIVDMSVESVKMELPDTKTVRLKWPDGYDPEFKTGQFITLYFPDTPAYKRAYSLSSCAMDRGHYEVTVKRDGKMGTRIVDWVKEGDKFFVIPPTGVRTTNDIIFNEEFCQLQQENPNFNFYVTCTRLHPEDPWTGRRGRINAELIRELIHDPDDTFFYAWT